MGPVARQRPGAYGRGGAACGEFSDPGAARASARRARIRSIIRRRLQRVALAARCVDSERCRSAFRNDVDQDYETARRSSFQKAPAGRAGPPGRPPEFPPSANNCKRTATSPCNYCEMKKDWPVKSRLTQCRMALWMRTLAMLQSELAPDVSATFRIAFGSVAVRRSHPADRAADGMHPGGHQAGRYATRAQAGRRPAACTGPAAFNSADRGDASQFAGGKSGGNSSSAGSSGSSRA